jgi:hypothetical protein
MLGVGLHSYGFMDQAFAALLIFIFSQLAIVALGMLPHKYWRGIQARKTPTGLPTQERQERIFRALESGS